MVCTFNQNKVINIRRRILAPVQIENLQPSIEFLHPPIILRIHGYATSTAFSGQSSWQQ